MTRLWQCPCGQFNNTDDRDCIHCGMVRYIPPPLPKQYRETDADRYAEDVWHHRYDGQAEHAD